MQSQHIFIARGILISVGVASRKNNELLVRKKKKSRFLKETYWRSSEHDT